VWLHHFFTMGAGANVNAIFGIASMIIAVPTGVKVYNWLFTMYGGRIVYDTPMLWAIGFMVTFVIGGLTGVLVAVPPADFMVHNSLFLVAHFHNVIIGGVLFGAFAGYTFWFPKAFGFRLHEGWGKAAFWCWFFGFYLAFVPLYVVGIMGMTRRMQHYDVAAWHPWPWSWPAGAVVLPASCVRSLSSFHPPPRNCVTHGDPDGSLAEWVTSSPPGLQLRLSRVESRRLCTRWRSAGRGRQSNPFQAPIEMPRNSPIFICAFFATRLRHDLANLVMPLSSGRCARRARLPGAIASNMRSRRRKSLASTAPTAAHGVKRAPPWGPPVTAFQAGAATAKHRARGRAGAGRSGFDHADPASAHHCWLPFLDFLLSDIVMFSAFSPPRGAGETAGGLSGRISTCTSRDRPRALPASPPADWLRSAPGAPTASCNTAPAATCAGVGFLAIETTNSSA
jgi:hypothetical protein